MAGLGKIEFKIKFQDNKLDLTVLGCKDLKNKELLGKSDPYVRLYLMPGRHMDLKTKSKSNSLSPSFNETFSFTITVDQLRSKTVVLQVFDADFGKDQPMGEVQLSMRDVDLSYETTLERDLHPVSGQPPILKTKKYSTSSVTSISNVTSRSTNSRSSLSAMHNRQTVSSASVHSQSHTYTPTLNLRELNNRLDSVIARNKRDDDLDISQIIVTLVSEKVEEDHNIKRNYMSKDMTKAFEDFGQVEAEIYWLEMQNEIMRKRTGEIDKKIEDANKSLNQLTMTEGELKENCRIKQTKIMSLETTITSLKNELENVDRHRETEIKTTRAEHARWEEELRYVKHVTSMQTDGVERILKEMTAETECPSIYWNKVYNKVREEYNMRMNAELKQMNELFIRFKDEIKEFEIKEIQRLKMDLGHGKNPVSQGEIDVLVTEMETFKTQILKLEMDRYNLKQKLTDLNFSVKEDEHLYQGKLKARSDALAYLQAQYKVMQESLKLKLGRVDMHEVIRYNTTITEALGDVTRRSDNYTGSGDPLIGISLLPKRDSDGRVSWSIEDHYS